MNVKTRVSIGFFIIMLSYISIACFNFSEPTQISLTKEYDGIDISYVVAGPNAYDNPQENDFLEVYATVKDNDTVIDEMEFEVSKFHIYSDMEGNNLVKSGDLKYDDEEEKWQVENFDLAWTGSGKFYVTVEFKTEDMDESVETDISDKETYTYTRVNIIEPLILLFSIVGVVVGIIAIVMITRSRRHGMALEGKKKEKKEKVTIKEISKTDLKKKGKKENTKKKEKGKTEAKEDLIFSVPQWDIEEDEEE